MSACINRSICVFPHVSASLIADFPRSSRMRSLILTCILLVMVGCDTTRKATPLGEFFTSYHPIAPLSLKVASDVQNLDMNTFAHSEQGFFGMELRAVQGSVSAAGTSSSVSSDNATIVNDYIRYRTVSLNIVITSVEKSAGNESIASRQWLALWP
jgi:hypothetical protein